jgi:hypothetical protein
LRLFREKVAASQRYGTFSYFVEEDDFRGIQAGAPSAKKRGTASGVMLAALAVFTIYGGGFLALSKANTLRASRIPPPDLSSLPAVPVTNTPLSPISSRSQRPGSTPFNIPEIEKPASGEVRTFTSRQAIAPLEIESARGADYLVKVSDSLTDELILTIYVQGGGTVKAYVPLGTYTIKYASGEHWYGYWYLFGPSTSYSKAQSTFDFTLSGNQISGYSLTLYKVPYGNLHTVRTNPNEF